MEKRGYKLQEFVAHTSHVNCVNIGKKSCRVFATGGEDRKVNLWAVGKATSLLSLSGHTSSVQSITIDSAEVLVLAGSSSGTIKLWDLEEAKIMRTLTGHRSNCTAVEFHPFGEFFASGSSDTDLKIWDIRKKGCIHTYKGHTRGVRTIKFTPDGRWVVTGGEDNVVKCWDLTAGKLLHDFKFHCGPIRCIDFHPNEFLLATGSADRTVKFWDLETFELIGSAGPELSSGDVFFFTKYLASGVRSMIFHPDGKTLLCGLDETLKVFSWEPLRCHDIVEMGWSTLGDLSVYDGKLLGCSYYQSRVGVWVADISLIGPYAPGVTPMTNTLMEPVYSHVDYLSNKLTVSCTISGAKLVEGSLNPGSKANDYVRSQCMISSECCQSVIQKSDQGSMVPMSATGFQKCSATVSCHSAPSKFDSRFSSKKSSLNSSTFRGGKTTEIHPIVPNRTESSFASRDVSLRSSSFNSNSPHSLKRVPILEAKTVNGIQAMNRSVSLPVIVPRDHLDMETAASCRKLTVPTDATHGTIIRKGNHNPKSSIVSDTGESQLIATVSKPSSDMVSNIASTSSNLLSRVIIGETALADEKNHSSIKNFAERSERIMSTEQQMGLINDKSSESPCSSIINGSVKYVRGVAVPLGKTKFLVESWERREKCNNGSTSTANSSDQVPKIDNLLSIQKGQVQTSEMDVTSADDCAITEALLQSHDVFINSVKSRLTKLQVVRHVWEHNGIKGAINAVTKLPDHSVQVDVTNILKEKIDLFTLDLFTSSLPMLAGLLNSKTERYVAICLEMLLELLKIFGPVIHSTLTASSLVGVDLQAKQRLERCNQCFKHLENIQKVLPSLIRRGDFLAKHAQALTLILYDL